MEHDIDMSRQGVSKRLDVLEEAGLIAWTRQGKYKILKFAGDGHITAVAAWLDRLAENNTNTETKRK